MRVARHRRDRRGLTLIELMVAISILSILGWALVQLLASGMTTWRAGEMRRGAYERAQFIFDRIGRDLTALYPHNPPMPDEWSFQADTLFAPYDGTGIAAVSFASDNISLVEGEVRYLKPTNSSEEAWIQYQFELPFEAKTVVVQPRITLARSEDGAPTCRVIVDAAKDEEDFTPFGILDGGSHDVTVTPSVNVSDAVSGGKKITVRIRVVPDEGKVSDVKLFEAKQDEPVRPVFRFAASPKKCLTGIQLICDLGSRGLLMFVRSDRGLQDVIYVVDDNTLVRLQRDVGDIGPDNKAQMAKGIAYFGCEFQNKYELGGDDEEEIRIEALQRYWVEADSVPPYVTVIVSTVPLSGPKRFANLSAAISATDKTIRVGSTRSFVGGNPSQQFIKIGNEWISYTELKADRFTGCVRGVRGTMPSDHDKGSAVIGAETFRLNISIPAWGYRNR